MTRASWKGALLAGLASAGIAWAEPAPPGGAARPAERTVTIRQTDGIPESCRLLKAWTTADGHKAWLLQSVESDMLLTVVEKARGPASARNVGVSIYRWGNSSTPPEGSPLPPLDNPPIRQAAYTPEAPEPPRPAAPVLSTPRPTSALVIAPAADCAPGHCDKAPCDQVHHFERPPSLHFVPGGCLPVFNPEHSTTYGYYPTQWHPYPGCAEPAPLPGPAGQAEPVPAPKVSLP
jgi:hypothetical protein